MQGDSAPLRGEGDSPALPEDIRLSVAAVARRIGVAPATLRTWDRRYGLGPSEHSAGQHRRYTAGDVRRLEAMQRLLQLGSPPAEAARAAMQMEDFGRPPTLPEGDEASARSGGGTVVSIPGGTPSARGLARAAMALDTEGCAQIVRDSIERRGVVATWGQLLSPVLGGIGMRWESSGTGVEVEHLLSEVVIAAFQGRIAALTQPINRRSVLLSCAPRDLHTLPLFATAAALAERRVSSRILGARVPIEALVAASRRTGPGAVLVWSQMEQTAVVEGLEELAELRPKPLVLLGGPGWGAMNRPGSETVTGLQEAVTLISRAVCV